MNTFGRYLRYRLKDSWLRSVIMTVLATMLSQNIISSLATFHSESEIRYCSSGISVLATVLCIFATLIPFMETKCFKNRRNLDTLYFFPIKRSRMALAHYLSGLIQLSFLYTVTFFTAFIYLEINTWYFRLGYMIPYFFMSLLLGVVIYSIFIFIFGQANITEDGVVFSFFWIGTIAFLMGTTETIINDICTLHELSTVTLPYSWGIIYAPMNNLTCVFQYLIEINKIAVEDDIDSVREILKHSYWFFIWIGLAAAAVYGYIKTFIGKGAQKAGEVSDSWFGYKTLIPLYGYFGLYAVGFRYDISFILVFISMIIGYIIYRRSIRLRLSDIITVALGVVPMLLGELLRGNIL